MGPTDAGYVSNITRAETWECDYNGHWNTRFYTRAFQYASETVALLDGKGNPGTATIRSRHIRFHRELLSGDPVLVRSVAVQGGRWNGAVVHLLESDGTLSATALDMPGCASQHLPQVHEQALAHALPRGLLDDAPLAQGTTIDGRRANLGILRPGAYDHTGALMFDELFRYLGYASYDHHVSLSYSPQFTAQSGVGRMVVEMRATWLGQAPAGRGLRSNSWLMHAQSKSFATAHYLETLEGAPIALIELCLVAVDMASRRATRVPDFLLAHAPSGQSHDAPAAIASSDGPAGVDRQLHSRTEHS
ncbi:thioesterase family protein [Pseudorhodoferax sp.]|uniref:thioesterase family protein n=1 Tax=Pseudorhodoferax sp. TaxID=1993553 RepID=UPI0039E680A8